MNVFLETKRLIIKPSEQADLNNLSALQSDQEVMKYIGQGVRSLEEVKSWLEKSILHYKKHEFSFGSVFEKESGTFVGQAGIMYLNYDDTQLDIEIGYRLHKKYWNCGYASELAKALVRWGFKNLPGLYECIDFKKYWEDENSFPFLVRYQNEIAGFVIVDKKGSNSEIDFNMAQFFVLRKFKSKGIGKYVAQECFKKFPGVWEVMVMPGNEGAYRFWRATIKDYTHNDFTEYTRDIAHFNNSRKNIFKFHSRVVS